MDAEALSNLVRWAQAKGVKLNGVEPRHIPGRGTGIVATRALEEGEKILTVPMFASRRRDIVPLTNWPLPFKAQVDRTVQAASETTGNGQSVTRQLPDSMAVHGILAAELALQEQGREMHRGKDPPLSPDPWIHVMPSREDVWTSMPLMWDARLEQWLPPPARVLLHHQQDAFGRDWSDLRHGLPATETERTQHEVDPPGDSEGEAQTGTAASRPPCLIPYDTYLYHWLLVNTRSFYYLVPGTESRVPNRKDRLCLQPVADMFNHAAEEDPDTGAVTTADYDFVQDDDDDGDDDDDDEDDGGGDEDKDATAAAAAASDSKSSRSHQPPRFVFRTRRAYAPGDEVCVSYGRYSNDFLLIEYGFVPAENVWDEVCIDDAVMPALQDTEAARSLCEQLAEAHFLSGYMVDAKTPGGCFRTQVAVRAALSLKGGSDGGDNDNVGDDGWQRFATSGGWEDGSDREEQRRVDAELARMLRAYGETIEDKLEKLGKAVEVGRPSQRAMLALRWRQIRDMVEGSVKWLESQAGGV